MVLIGFYVNIRQEVSNYSLFALSHPLETPPPCPAGLPIPRPLQWQFSDQPSQSLSCPLEGKTRMSSVAKEYPFQQRAQVATFAKLEIRER